MSALANVSLAASNDSRQIMVLCDKAIGELNEARSVEDVLDMRNVADAFGIYLRKMKAALEARTAVQTVVLLAEAKIGAELKAAQDRGEVAKPGGDQRSTNVRAPDNDPATLPELGIPRQRAAEYKKMAVVGEERIRQVVAGASSEGRLATRTEILETMRPAAAAAAEQVIAFQRKQATKPEVQPRSDPIELLVEKVKGPGPAWTDWTSAVADVATLDADFPTLARAIFDYTPTLLQEARAALPRLQAWIAELESAHV